jgi:hypothetical protein
MSNGNSFCELAVIPKRHLAASEYRKESPVIPKRTTARDLLFVSGRGKRQEDAALV